MTVSTKCFSTPESFVYLTAWPGLGIVKFGFTGHLRTRTARYTSKRGGVVLWSREFPTVDDGFRAEDLARTALRRKWPRAFTERGAAADLLGGRGSGWTECLSVPDHRYQDAVDTIEEALNG